MLELVRNNNKAGLEKYLDKKKAESPQLLEKELHRVVNKDSQWTVLHVAAQGGREEVLRLLLGYITKEVDPVEFQNRTPLWSAVLNGYFNCALVLLRAGANVNHLDLQKANLLHWCFSSEDKNAINFAKFVLRYGVNCRHARNGGMTPLYQVYSRKLAEEWWTLLLDHGAGICCDFTKMKDIDPEFLKKITENKVIIGSLSNVDLSKAITNCKQMESAIQKGIYYNFKALLKTVRMLNSEEQEKCLSFFVPAIVPAAVTSETQADSKSKTKTESPLIAEFKRLKRLQLAKQGHSRIKPLRALSIKYVVQHILLKDNPDAETIKRQQLVYTHLPVDLIDDISMKKISKIKRPK